MYSTLFNNGFTKGSVNKCSTSFRLAIYWTSLKQREPRHSRSDMTRQAPQRSNLNGPKHLHTSEFRSMSAITDHATERKMYTKCGSYSIFSLVKSIRERRPLMISHAASSTPYYSPSIDNSDLIRPLPVPPGIAPKVSVSFIWSQSLRFSNPFTISCSKPSPLTDTIPSKRSDSIFCT